MEGISVPVAHPVVIAMEGIKASKVEEFLDLGHKFFRDAGREEFYNNLGKELDHYPFVLCDY